METNELKTLWKTLANEKLIPEGLAEENINRLIVKQKTSLKQKLKRRIITGLWVYIIAAIVAVLLLMYVRIDTQKALPFHVYVGIFIIVSFLIMAAWREYSKVRVINSANKNTSLKSGLENMKTHLEKIIKTDYYFNIAFSFVASLLILFHFIRDAGGIKNIHFGHHDVFLQSPVFIIFFIIGLCLVPWMSKKEINLKFARIMGEINEMYEELNQKEMHMDNNENAVELMRVESMLQAKEIQTVLEEKGIYSMLKSDNAASSLMNAYTGMSAIETVSIFVIESEFEKAYETLKEVGYLD